MKCPVCGQDCIQSSDDLLKISVHRFDACPSCHGLPRNKQLSPDPDFPPPPCPVCGKRYIDDVFFHIWLILTEEKVIPSDAPLIDAGVPHLHPFMVLRSPPYLPKKSLILLTHAISKTIADRLMEEIPELRGVVCDHRIVPGLSDGIDSAVYHTHECITGCDLHATIFSSPAGNIVVYQRSSTMHIEMPRPFNPKLLSLSRMIDRKNPALVIDGCCGVGTLGIAAGLAGMPHIILNDRWYAAAYWSAVNIEVNRQPLKLQECVWSTDWSDLSAKKVRRCPIEILQASGENLHISVLHGDFRCLPRKLSDLSASLCVFDPFEKNDHQKLRKIMDEWKENTGGQIFMP
ncbi:hypothetical protein McpSp1_15340 [Methanocorpusculaceae archaeon Sp1]|nr:hypothetical protein [Methanocorpusculaceae archaeon Sp1]